MASRRAPTLRAASSIPPETLGCEIVCIDDGLVYPSISAAARHYGCTQAAISWVLLGKNKTAAGRQFARVIPSDDRRYLRKRSPKYKNRNVDQQGDRTDENEQNSTPVKPRTKWFVP